MSTQCTLLYLFYAKIAAFQQKKLTINSHTRTIVCGKYIVAVTADVPFQSSHNHSINLIGVCVHPFLFGEKKKSWNIYLVLIVNAVVVDGTYRNKKKETMMRCI